MEKDGYRHANTRDTAAFEGNDGGFRTSLTIWLGHDGSAPGMAIGDEEGSRVAQVGGVDGGPGVADTPLWVRRPVGRPTPEGDDDILPFTLQILSCQTS